MKCVITQQETNTLTKGIPLSREGRLNLDSITERYNNEIKKQFKKRFKLKTNDSEEAAEEIASVMAPKFSKHKILKMLVNNTEEDLFKPFEEKGEVVEKVEESEVE